MKKVCQFALVFGLAALIASPALAQSHGGKGKHGAQPRGFAGFGGGSTFLLSQESVQKDLKLSNEQVTKLKDVQKKQHEAFKSLGSVNGKERWSKMGEQVKASHKAVNEILKPEQQKRLKEITLQREGTRALSHKSVAEALKITDEQKGKIKTIREEARKEMTKARSGGNNQDARKKLSEVRKSTDEKVLNVLTSEQKAKLKELQGAPFTGEIRMSHARGEHRGGQKKSQR